MVDEIHKSGGRFLKQSKDPQSSWMEISLEESRSKIMHMFRNMKRRRDTVHKTETEGTPITGDPLPNDVKFGRAQKSAGNHRYQQIIKTRLKDFDAMDRGEKVTVVDAVIEDIREGGGRFLLLEPDSGKWLEASTDVIRTRISKSFRNHRRKTKKTTSG